MPIGVVLTGGEVYDSKAFGDLIAERDRVPAVLLADRRLLSVAAIAITIFAS